jgi:hypothetical protein
MVRQKILYLAIFSLLMMALLIFSPAVTRAPGKDGSIETKKEITPGSVDDRASGADAIGRTTGDAPPADNILSGLAGTVSGTQARESQYSRINFFLSAPARASLAIPATWEGWYLTQETTRTTDFLYTTPAGEKQTLFTIRWFDQADWNAKVELHKTATVLGSTDGFIFTAEKQGSADAGRMPRDRYEQMIEETEAVLGSFKSYKN